MIFWIKQSPFDSFYFEILLRRPQNYLFSVLCVANTATFWKVSYSFKQFCKKSWPENLESCDKLDSIVLDLPALFNKGRFQMININYTFCIIWETAMNKSEFFINWVSIRMSQSSMATVTSQRVMHEVNLVIETTLTIFLYKVSWILFFIEYWRHYLLSFSKSCVLFCQLEKKTITAGGNT